MCVVVVGGGGGTRSLEKIDIFPCSPKSKSRFSMFPVPPNCLCSHVPFNFRLLFQGCSPEISGLISLIPKTPEREVGKMYVFCMVFY